tara:strand:- start:2842 stop:3057 length:216 start_codon:yes stop_codon:yes gene_type:complete
MSITFRAGLDRSITRPLAEGTTLGAVLPDVTAALDCGSAQATVNGVVIGEDTILQDGQTVVLQTVSHSKAS